MHPLDNVIWRALTTSQAHLAEGQASARKFHRKVSLLGGFTEPGINGYESLAALVVNDERIGLFLEQAPRPPDGWSIVSSVPLLQMEAGDGELDRHQSFPFVQLGSTDVPEMMALTRLTKPGPFGERTHEMGHYFGIRQDAKLIAMAGERLRIPGYTEISAVCTHPGHLGRGLARALINLLMQRIRDRGERPFLHVRPYNRRAAELYERMGFRRRVLLQYAVLTKRS